MRIAVDCRFLGLGPVLMTRGIPRYTQQQLRSVLQLDADNEYILLCPPDGDRRHLHRDIRTAPNVSFETFPGARRSGLPDRALTLRETEIFERWLIRERVSLYHATVPWLPVATVFPAIYACPVVGTVYDVIPSLFPEHLVPGLREGWFVAVEQLRRSTRLIAISAVTARDTTFHLGVPPERIDVAHPFAERWFRPLEAADVRERLARLRQRLPLPDRFGMTISFVGFRNKNLETLLAAYQHLAPSTRRSLPLVVVGIQGPTADGLRTAAQRYGVERDVIATGVVSDEELTALYNAATMFVCPSKYEGFGMPIVEAMQCGAPVIATTAAAIPEVTGDAAWLVDPNDARGIAVAIEALASEPDRRESMRRAGLARAATFTSEALGRTTLETYRRAAAAAPREAARPRVAICSRVAPQPGDDARWSLELAQAFSARYDVELFVDGDGLPDVAVLQRHRVQHVSALERRQREASFAAVFCVPDVRAGGDSLPSPLRDGSGIAILHETPAADVVRHLIDGSRAVIVPTDPAAEQLGDRRSGVIAILPGVADPLAAQPTLQAEQARAHVGITTETFAVGWFDATDDTSAVVAALLAFADLCRVCPQALLLVGHPGGVLPPLMTSLATTYGVLPRLRAVGALDPVNADTYLLACDVVLALAVQDSTPSPLGVLRACAAGKPAVISDVDGWRWVPTDACWRVPTGATAAAVLGHALRTLAGDDIRRRAMGRAGRGAYEHDFTTASMLARYGRALALETPGSDRARSAQADERPSITTGSRQPSPSPPMPFNKVCEIEDFARDEIAAVIREVMAHKHARFGEGFPRGAEHCKDWEVAMAVRTLREFGALRPDASILGVAAGMEDTMYYLSRHVREVMVVDRYAQPGMWSLNAPMWMLVMPQLGAQQPCVPERLIVQHMDARRLRFPDDRFDGIFSSGSIEHFGGLMDVAHAAFEMGRVLKPGGILSITTIIAIGGPRDRLGAPGSMLMFRREHLERYIVEASGLDLIDPLETNVSIATWGARRPLDATIHSYMSRAAGEGLKGQQEDYVYNDFPSLVLDWEGFTFDSVHLALRKPLRHTPVLNAWARPTEAIDAAIAADCRRLVEERSSWSPSIGTPPAPIQPPELAIAVAREQAVRMQRHLASGLLAEIAGVASENARLAAASNPSTGGALPANWTPVQVQMPDVPPYSILVDRTERRDILVNALLAGHSAILHQPEVGLMRALTAPGDTIVDAGAHLGTMTLPMAAAGYRVLAVEASARNAALLRASVARNGFRHVRVVRAAAAESEGSIGFYSDGAWGCVAAPGEACSEFTPAVRLDDLIDLLGWGRVSLVKIDIEGFEPEAIRGLSRTLSRADAPFVFYESNAHTLGLRGARPGGLIAALEAFGYRCFRYTPGLLTRVRPEDVQTDLVVDHLAVKGAIPHLPHTRVADRLETH